MIDDPSDWREYAHLTVEHWPEAIPVMGPKRQYGPHPWGTPTHEDEYGLDTYPNAHPDAASIGHQYLGDVCPYCGVPLRFTETVVLLTGERGEFHEIDDVADPTPAYHPDCWTEREAERHRQENKTLTQYVTGDDEA